MYKYLIENITKEIILMNAKVKIVVQSMNI